MKKVRCIDNNGAEELSLEKTYYVKKEDGAFYTVSVKEGTMASYLKWRFEEIKSNDELDIIEASNMPLGTEFQILYPNGDIDNLKCKVTKSGRGNMISWVHNEESIGGTQNIINAKFISIKQKPISFMEAVSSEKNMIKVDIEDIICGLSENMKEQLREYNTIGATLYCLSNYFTNESLVKIFQEGKWYIEED